MGFGIGLAAWAKANPLPPPEPAGFIVGDWSVEYPEPQPTAPRDVFPRRAMRDKP